MNNNYNYFIWYDLDKGRRDIDEQKFVICRTALWTDVLEGVHNI